MTGMAARPVRFSDEIMKIIERLRAEDEARAAEGAARGEGPADGVHGDYPEGNGAGRGNPGPRLDAGELPAVAGEAGPGQPGVGQQAGMHPTVRQEGMNPPGHVPGGGAGVRRQPGALVPGNAGVVNENGGRDAGLAGVHHRFPIPDENREPGSRRLTVFEMPYAATVTFSATGIRTEWWVSRKKHCACLGKQEYLWADLPTVEIGHAALWIAAIGGLEEEGPEGLGPRSAKWFREAWRGLGEKIYLILSAPRWRRRLAQFLKEARPRDVSGLRRQWPLICGFSSPRQYRFTSNYRCVLPADPAVVSLFEALPRELGPELEARVRGDLMKYPGGMARFLVDGLLGAHGLPLSSGGECRLIHHYLKDLPGWRVQKPLDGLGLFGPEAWGVYETTVRMAPGRVKTLPHRYSLWSGAGISPYLPVVRRGKKTQARQRHLSEVALLDKRWAKPRTRWGWRFLCRSLPSFIKPGNPDAVAEALEAMAAMPHGAVPAEGAEEKIESLLRYLAEGYFIPRGRAAEEARGMEAVGGTLMECLRQAMNNHLLLYRIRQAQQVLPGRRRAPRVSDEAPLIAPPLLPELEELRVKTVGELRDLGHRFHHCIGSLHDRGDLFFFDGRSVCAQVSPRRFTLVDCRDSFNRHTPASNDFIRRLSDLFLKMADSGGGSGDEAGLGTSGRSDGPEPDIVPF